MPKIIIAGIGGQGIITSARVLGNIGMNSGFDVKVSEIHGMSQRGGNVEAHVTIGEKVYSPVIEKGKADILISYNLDLYYIYRIFLCPTGEAVAITEKESLDETSPYGNKLLCINTEEIIRRLQDKRFVNMVPLGKVCNRLGYEFDCCIETIKKEMKQDYIEKCIIAFEYGFYT